MDVVLIPCFRRPELLFHCLKNIQAAHGADEHHYIFRFDFGHSPELDDALRLAEFTFSHQVARTPKCNYQVAKQSFSLLTGYHLALSHSFRPERVYLIEEDVMIATDFFRWHQEVHAQRPDVFCSIGVVNPNRKVQEGARDEFYLTTEDYCSLGVCFPANVLKNYILQWATTKYYNNPIDFCQRNFKGSPFGQSYAEQDGLIRRIQWQAGMAMPIAYPYQGRAYHAGYYGYNRGRGPDGSLVDRIAKVRDVIYSDEAMRTFAKHPSWYEDSKPINLKAEPWQSLCLNPLP